MLQRRRAALHWLRLGAGSVVFAAALYGFLFLLAIME
jgi:hypothetical protein